MSSNPQDSAVRCPCCDCKTIGERGGYEICAVCGWEDDGQDDDNAADVLGGPNDRLSLAQARVNYRQFGASCREHLTRVRSPRADEV